MTSLQPFNKLVMLAARMFYDDVMMKGNNQSKTSKSDTRGIVVVTLEALTRRQWVSEEDLAKDLKLHSKQLRRTLRFLEEERFVTREHKKEKAKVAKIPTSAIGNGDHQNAKEGEVKIKMHTHSYCCLDYSQIYDVVRYRLHRMKKKLKDELENRDTIQIYVCPKCTKKYTAFDALRLISPYGDAFNCESCNGELVAESDKLAAEEMGDCGGDHDNARRKKREKLKDMLQRMEIQLKLLMEQLNRIKDLTCPEFVTLQTWREAEARAAAANRAENNDDSYKELAWMQDLVVKVEDTKLQDAGAASTKVIPPWLITQGMNLTKEQRGEVGSKEELNMYGNSDLSYDDDKKSTKVITDHLKEDDVKSTSLQDEYIKAYYAALLKRQQEQEELAAMNRRQEELAAEKRRQEELAFSDIRRVGMKSKREEDESDIDDVEWEEAPIPTSTIAATVENYMLNEQAEEFGDDEDEIDWEEG